MGHIAGNGWRWRIAVQLGDRTGKGEIAILQGTVRFECNLLVLCYST